MDQKSQQTKMARCVECDARINFMAQPDLGDTVVCPECRTHLEVVALSPLELYWTFADEAYYEEEAYGYSDEFDYPGNGDVYRIGDDE